ncbi:MAG TPA: hypothetical protein VFP69_01890, partial [Streptomyces sp.]|nr:hypothetical protein [Streptomyces sp.]
MSGAFGTAGTVADPPSAERARPGTPGAPDPARPATGTPDGPVPARLAAVFVPAPLPRHGKVAFWDPEGAPLPVAAADRTQLTVVRPHGRGARR